MATRGSSIRVRQSLRTKIYAATGLVFFGLAALLCVVLPQAYEHQARDDFGHGVKVATAGFATLVAGRLSDEGATASDVLTDLAPWLESQTGIESAALLDGEGRTLGVWPTGSPLWSEDLVEEGETWNGSSFYSLTAAIPGPSNPGTVVARVAVRASSARLVRTLEGVRWLFFSVFLLGGVAFFGFTKYLTSTILQPLEGIRRAARDLADGELVVRMPESGDEEISELGEFIDQLGDSRRHSRILQPSAAVMKRFAEKAARGESEPKPTEETTED